MDDTGKYFMVFFVIPEYEDYDDRHEPLEQSIVYGFDIDDVSRKFMKDIPEAYIKNIIQLPW